MVPCRLTGARQDVDYPLWKPSSHSQLCKLQGCQGRDLEEKTGIAFLRPAVLTGALIPSFVGVVHTWGACTGVWVCTLMETRAGCCCRPPYCLETWPVTESEAWRFSQAGYNQSVCIHVFPTAARATGTSICVQLLRIQTQVYMLAKLVLPPSEPFPCPWHLILFVSYIALLLGF